MKVNFQPMHSLSYSQTSLIRTPKGQNRRSPLYRGVRVIEVGKV